MTFTSNASAGYSSSAVGGGSGAGAVVVAHGPSSSSSLSSSSSSTSSSSVSCVTTATVNAGGPQTIRLFRKLGQWLPVKPGQYVGISNSAGPLLLNRLQVPYSCSC